MLDVLLSLLLTALLVYAAVRKLSHRPEVVAQYARVGVPENRLNVLAGLLLAGGAGLVAGIFLPLLGTAAAAALVLYFLGAVAVHIRARDRAIATPLVLLGLAIAVLALRMAGA